MTETSPYHLIGNAFDGIAHQMAHHAEPRVKIIVVSHDE